MFEPIVKYDVQETRRIARAEGIAEGKAEGKVEGKAEGKAEGKVETARGMKAENIPVATIAKITGLSAAEVEKL